MCAVSFCCTVAILREGLQLLDCCYINYFQDVMPYLSLKMVRYVMIFLDIHPQSLKSSFSK